MKKESFTLNTSQKIIWTVYLATLFVTLSTADFMGYLVVGWIPFLIAHILWRHNKYAEEMFKRKYTRLKNALIVLNGKDNKIKILAEKEFKNKECDKFAFGMALYPNEGWVFLDDIYEALDEKEHDLSRRMNATR